MIQIKENSDFSLDGKQVKYVGIITSIKKKYTKKNTLMAFITVEDLYGSTEIIVFDSCYSKSEHILLNENVVLIEGRLSIREDDDVKIVASNITEFDETKGDTKGDRPLSFQDPFASNENFVGADASVRPQVQRHKLLTINITNLSEDKKAKLRGAIKFFSGDKNNIAISVKNNEQVLPCGAIYITKEILEQFEEIVGKENIVIQ